VVVEVEVVTLQLEQMVDLEEVVVTARNWYRRFRKHTTSKSTTRK
jgi:hypothetical protein